MYPCASLLLLNVMFVRFIHVLCIATVCLFSLCYSVPFYENATVNFSVLLLKDIWVFPPFLVLMNSTALSVLIPVFW